MSFIRKLGEVDVYSLVVTKPNRVLALHVALILGRKGYIVQSMLIRYKAILRMLSLVPDKLSY